MIQRWFRHIAVALCTLNALWGGDTGAQTHPYSAVLTSVFPAGDRAGPVSGSPPAAPVFNGNTLAGYIYSTSETIGSVGYSGTPFDIVVGVDLNGTITGARLLEHNEPILVIGIPAVELEKFVAGFAGLSVTDSGHVDETKSPVQGVPDFISGASVTSAVMRDAVIRSARAVVFSRGFGHVARSVEIDRGSFTNASWSELVGDDSISALTLRRRDITAALPESTDTNIGQPDDLFIDLYVTMLTPPRVGQNLLGSIDYNQALSSIEPSEHLLFVAASGLYSFKGTRYVRTGMFDRLQLAQGEQTYRFRKESYANIEELEIEGAPNLREMGLFTVSEKDGFDPLAPFRLQLLVERKSNSGASLRSVFDLPYELPESYRIKEGGLTGSITGLLGLNRDTLWVSIWIDKAGTVIGICLMLGLLTAILFFQDVLVQRTELYRRVRLSYLAVTIIWLGWMVGGQLSVIHAITFVHALTRDFRWEYFLVDPAAFLLWGFVAMAMLFWGRGVYCGWLCPFGALQELLNETARRLRLRQITVPFPIHERLWTLKYILFLGIFAISLQSTGAAVVASEIEPFKTAISLKFIRAWPFVLYALVLLIAGLFIERFFCRYLCPLGAALAIPAKLHMFDWLKRRFQCGRSCHNCAFQCTVQAIHPDGSINTNECIQCLACQANYYDANFCPPLKQQLKKHTHTPHPTAGML